MDRRLDYPVFDADNHMYEQPDAFTRYLPDEYKNVIKYVQVNGRDKLAIKNVISEYIPNPTFNVVAASRRPGGVLQERQSRGQVPPRDPRQADPLPRGLLQARAPAPAHGRAGHRPRHHVADPGQRARGAPAQRPRGDHAVIHSFNQWMFEEWTFNYEDRIFATPVITLPIVDEAIREFDWIVEHGAKIILIRPAPVPSLKGFRSFALPEFDPFWAKVQEYDITVGHARLRRRAHALLQPVGGPPRRACCPSRTRRPSGTCSTR